MVTIDQIKEDHRSSQQRVYNLLLMWRQQTDDQSLAHLFHLMYKAGTSVTIDWNEIAHRLKIERRDIHACKSSAKFSKIFFRCQLAFTFLYHRSSYDMEHCLMDLYKDDLPKETQ
jgi:hypothetical protein